MELQIELCRIQYNRTLMIHIENNIQDKALHGSPDAQVNTTGAVFMNTEAAKMIREAEEIYSEDF